MRGALGHVKRFGRTPMLPSEANAIPYTLPAPYKGWNARGNLANMDPLQAIQMDNIFPGVQQVSIRKGCIDWATAAPATIHSLMPYSGLTTSKMFAATNAGIYDVTGNAPFGAAAVACTNGFWQSLMMATSGGNFLFAVNGTDLAKTFDGAAWAIPAITVATSSTWSYITLHKRRIWAIQKDTLDLWYMPTDSIAGAAAKFPVGPLFKRGGKLVAIGTWTIDGGTGVDDLFVIVTSNGEIAVYQGTDPASVNTWALVGVYDVAKPVGSQPLFKFGGDLLYLGTTGIMPVSQLQQLDYSEPQVSYYIDGAFIDAATSYAANTGWQMIMHKNQNMLLVNVPVSNDVLSYQFVMNTTTKAWCRFTGWNASCWAELNGELYFGGGLKVSKAWNGVTDAGAPIIGTCLQAYSGLGSKRQKNISLVRPNFGIFGSAQVQLAFDADFKTFGGKTIFTYQPVSIGAIWDSSHWEAGIWDGGTTIIDPTWLTVPGNLGNLHSLRLQVTTSTGSFVWTSTDFALRGAGIL